MHQEDAPAGIEMAKTLLSNIPSSSLGATSFVHHKSPNNDLRAACFHPEQAHITCHTQPASNLVFQSAVSKYIELGEPQADSRRLGTAEAHLGAARQFQLLAACEV
jgi:hypothetical protein